MREQTGLVLVGDPNLQYRKFITPDASDSVADAQDAGEPFSNQLEQCIAGGCLNYCSRICRDHS